MLKKVQLKSFNFIPGLIKSYLFVFIWHVLYIIEDIGC